MSAKYEIGCLSRFLGASFLLKSSDCKDFFKKKFQKRSAADLLQEKLIVNRTRSYKLMRLKRGEKSENVFKMQERNFLDGAQNRWKNN